jgi:HEAT repeats
MTGWPKGAISAKAGAVSSRYYSKWPGEIPGITGNAFLICYSPAVQNRVKSVPLAVLLMTLSLILWEFYHEKPDPIIDGRPLSFWTSREGSAYELPSPSSDTNAIQLYVKLVGMRQGSLGHAYEELWPKLPSWLQRRWPQPYFPSHDRIVAAGYLSREAKSHPEVMPLLIDALENDPDPELRSHLVDCLTIHFSHDKTVVAALANAATDRDQRVRLTAVMNLGYCYRYPSVVVPALVGCLHDSDPRVRQFAACSLRKFGPSGSAATPGLSRLLQDTNRQVRLEASYALKQIDSAAAAKAGIK